MRGLAAAPADVHLSLLFPLRRFRALSRLLVSARPSPSTDEDARRDFSVLATGLHGVLSRHPQHVVRRDFPVSARALRSLRRQFGALFVEVSLPAEMLNDLGHEIALHADPDTRAAAARCLRRAVAGRHPAVHA